MANLQLPFGIEVLNQKPEIAKYFLSGETPYNSVAEVNSNLPNGIRHIGLTVNINNVEYWYEFGIADINLVLKGSAADIENVGSGTGIIYSGSSGSTALLRTLVGSGSTNITTVNDVIIIDSSGGGVRGVEIVTTGLAFTATTNSDYIGANVAVKTIYLPLSPLTGQEITISDEQGNAGGINLDITINGNGNLIDNSTSASINTNHGSITILYNGYFWKVISFSN